MILGQENFDISFPSLLFLHSLWFHSVLMKPKKSYMGVGGTAQKKGKKKNNIRIKVHDAACLRTALRAFRA